MTPRIPLCIWTSALATVPGRQDSLGESRGKEQHHPHRAQQEYGGVHPLREELGLGPECDVAQPFAGTDPFTHHGANDARRDGNLDSRKHVGQPVGHLGLEEHLPPVGAQCPHKVQQVPVGGPEAVHGVDQNGEEGDGERPR